MILEQSFRCQKWLVMFSWTWLRLRLHIWTQCILGSSGLSYEGGGNQILAILYICSNSTQGLCTLCLVNSNLSISRRRNLELERWFPWHTEFIMLGAKASYRATCYLRTSVSGDPWTCSQWNGHQVSKNALVWAWWLSNSSVHKNHPAGDS